MIVPMIQHLEEMVLKLKDQDFNKFKFLLKDKYGPFEEEYFENGFVTFVTCHELRNKYLSP